MTCDKTSYTTQRHARNAITGMNKSGKKVKMKIYFCSGCNAWHLATAGKKRALPNITTHSLKERKLKQFHEFKILNYAHP